MDTPPVYDVGHHRHSQPSLFRPQQPVDVRAGGTVFIKDADSIESLSPDQHRRAQPGVDDSILDRVAAFECIVDLGIVELLGLPEDRLQPWIGPECFDLARELVGLPEVVGIEEREEIPAAEGHACVPGRGDTTVLLLVEANRFAVPLHDLCGRFC